MLRMLPLGDCYPTLRNLAQLLAIQVLHGLLNALGATDELMQMAVIEWVQLEIKTEAANRAHWFRTIFSLLNSPSHAAKDQAATSLTVLSAAAEADNNVKLMMPKLTENVNVSEVYRQFTKKNVWGEATTSSASDLSPGSSKRLHLEAQPVRTALSVCQYSALRHSDFCLTGDTLQDLTTEFATLGYPKLVARPALHTLGPSFFHNITATIKVSSTETGVLNDVQVDMMNSATTTYLTEAQHLNLFERENKVTANTIISDPRQYMKHIMKWIDMAYLLPDPALLGDCDSVSANRRARSLFGGNALVSLSTEKTEDRDIQRHVRIRSKTQGIALSLAKSSLAVLSHLMAEFDIVAWSELSGCVLAQKAVVTTPIL
ncbi:hypothetical protein NliqN6_5870 [Naganishia liquefaciens]|uniref:Coatomer beta subunit appendage platform domain-containing protein n=1 Tax=Naganishia liquefaciens TaxID=104408 RepID=A0A8H3YHL3_9TREE|nr:hypothetical protein NliqN6_5870 [Naganishia liquefaciens]